MLPKIIEMLRYDKKCILSWINPILSFAQELYRRSAFSTAIQVTSCFLDSPMLPSKVSQTSKCPPCMHDQLFLVQAIRATAKSRPGSRPASGSTGLSTTELKTFSRPSKSRPQVHISKNILF